MIVARETYPYRKYRDVRKAGFIRKIGSDFQVPPNWAGESTLLSMQSSAMRKENTETVLRFDSWALDLIVPSATRSSPTAPPALPICLEN